MAKRLLLEGVRFDFVGRLEHLAEDWRALNLELARRNISSLGELYDGDKRAPPPEPRETAADRAVKAEVGRYALLEPPIPRTATDADVAHACRMLQPDLDCLGGAYVAPTLCRRGVRPGDRERGGSNFSLWNLWIQRKALAVAGGPGIR